MIDEISKADLAWIAGFMEGEGTIRFNSTMRVRASQRQLWPLHKIRDLCEGNLYEAKTPKGRSYGIWELTGLRAERLAFRLLPLMSPERQKQIYRALIARKLQPRRGSPANRTQCSRAGRVGGYPTHKKRLNEAEATL